MPALRASRIYQSISSTPSRAWLLTNGPSGLQGHSTLEIERWTLDVRNYRNSGVAAEVGCTDGFGSGGLVAVGIGGGGPKSTDFVGAGNGKVAGFPVFEFSFAFWFAFWFAPPMSTGLLLGTGEAETFALTLAFAVWLIVPPANPSFNPWKILIPSMIGLLVIFGVIYAFSRNSQPTGATPTGSPLTADPNSSPVESAKPPTGAAEAGIPAGGTINQTANANVNANVSASPVPSGSPIDIGGANQNANQNANENSNTGKPATSPLPLPTKSVDLGPPPPLPTATNPPLPKPSVRPTSAATPELR